jgi:hypothetical protein
MMKMLAATLFAMLIALALTYSATATAKPPTPPPAPACPQNTVTIGNQGQVVNMPQQSHVCDNDTTDDGLLGDLPLLGNLPGLGRVL